MSYDNSGSADLSARSQYIWQDDAACGGIDPDLFTIVLYGEESVKDLTAKEVTELNWSQVTFMKEEYCDGCPVAASCLSSADPSDRYWTIRGGQPPTRLIELQEAPKKKLRAPLFRFDDYKLWECKTHSRKYLKTRQRKNAAGEFYSAPFCSKCETEGKNPDRPR